MHVDGLATSPRSLAHSHLVCDRTVRFVCVRSSVVFLMQLGFAMVEVGAVSAKNINNILIKGTVDILVAA